MAARRSLSSAGRAALKVFLDLDNCLGPLQALLQPLILAAQPGDLSRLRVGLWTTLLRGQGLQSTGTALLTPFVQVRAVEPFPAQQSANLAPLRTSVGFRKDALLVFGGNCRRSAFGTTSGSCVPTTSAACWPLRLG